VREESVPVPILIEIFDLKERLALLRKRAGQEKLKLPTDAARYMTQNIQSNASQVESAITRLMARSSVSGTEITLKYTQQTLADLTAAEASKVAADPLEKLLSQPFGTKLAKSKHQDPTSEDRHFVFCLPETRDGRKTRRVRHELQVNMRERERDRLARWDAFERESECRAKKRKQG
jgi:hypothetical protein